MGQDTKINIEDLKTIIRLTTRRAIDRVLILPGMVWVLLGFFLSFVIFFVMPVYFDPSGTIQFNPFPIPISPIGFDFRNIVIISSTWLHTGVALAIIYPALTYPFFIVFTFFSPETGYKLLLLIILICFILATVVLPGWINRTRSLSAFSMLILVTGLGSYGLQFEMERGQWNLIAFTFCLAAIYLFHNQPKYRWLAYFLFCVSVQLKLYPAIFVFALIEDWSEWKNNIKRIVSLGLVNILALFILGINPILNSLRILASIKATHVGRPFNVSIASFISFIFTPDNYSHKVLRNPWVSWVLRSPLVSWVGANNWAPQLFLLVIFVICFLIIVWQAYKRGSKGFNPYIFMAGSIGALIIPSISFDYKLSFFPACIALCMPNIFDLEKNSKGLTRKVLTLIFSIAYSSMLYPYANKPLLIMNNLPALFVLLLICTTLSWMPLTRADNNLSEQPSIDPSA
jgi:Glycosyltransferase family 87